jgi:SAM-dependent methyltransferase
MSANSILAPNAPPRGCDLCGDLHVRELYNAEDRLRNSGRRFSIAACNGCGVLRTLPDMTEEELSAFYPNDYWGQESEASDEWIRSSQSDKLDFLRVCQLDRGRIVDVGCGSGWFLRTLDHSKWDRFGVENGGAAHLIASRELGAEHAFGGTLLEASLPDSFFDVVTFWSALEHMNHPRANLVKARRIIKPGGTIIIQVPNAASYQARAFKGNWFALDVPRHRYHFSRETIEALLKDTGFSPGYVTYRSSAHNAHALRQSLKSSLNAAASRPGYVLFCLVIPFIKPADSLLTRLAGGATLTIAATAV